MNAQLRHRLHRLVASLLLVTVALHALVPAGFMPGIGGGLAICPASALAEALARHGDADAPPTGPICHGGRIVDGESALLPIGAPADDDKTHNHDCPFAAGGAAALPCASATATFVFDRQAETSGRVRTGASSVQNRLSLPRGPPRARVVPPLQG
ncbi:hypothetical protein [Nevskia ramosa]|uniref:hypothetical protein n=1 Tax=Nevskia ramosa TaxID=64002 RepID=UPI003D1428EA